LAERAPTLLPNTAIIAEQEILPYMGDYPTAYGINATYAQKETGTSHVPYWFFAVSENFWGQESALLAGGMPLEAERHISTFSGDSRKSLFIAYDDSLSPCLWVLGPDSANLKDLSSFLRKASAISALDRIENLPAETSFPGLLGKPDNLAWCTIYQRSDLAKQFEEWEQVRQNWQFAQMNGLHPFHSYEYLPFIEAYAHLGDWETAYDLTRTANRVNAGMDSVLCPLWGRLETSATASPERDEAVARIKDKIGCQP
jgi:hypothetical protein